MTEASHGLSFNRTSAKFSVPLTADELIAISLADVMAIDLTLADLLSMRLGVHMEIVHHKPYYPAIHLTIPISIDNEETRRDIGDTIRRHIERGTPAAAPSEGPEPGSDEWIKSSVHYHPGDLA